MQSAHHSREGGEEPATRVWPQIWITIRRERERKGEYSSSSVYWHCHRTAVHGRNKITAADQPTMNESESRPVSTKWTTRNSSNSSSSSTVFVDLFTEIGFDTLAIVALDTAVDGSRKKMAGSVTRFPARLCSRNWNLSYHGCLDWVLGRPWVLFSCWFALLPTFSSKYYFLLFLYPGIFLFLVLLRLCSSRLLLSSKYVFLCHLYPASSCNSFCFKLFSMFRSSYFVGWCVVLSCPAGTGRYVSTWFTHVPWFIRDFLFFLSNWCAHKNCVSRMKNQDGHWVCCWCWVRERMV